MAVPIRREISQESGKRAKPTNPNNGHPLLLGFIPIGIDAIIVRFVYY